MRANFLNAAILSGLVALSGCAGAMSPGRSAVALREARECSTDLPPFKATFFTGVYEPNGTMTTDNDGGVCSLLVAFDFGTPSRLDVLQAPDHGVLTTDGIDVGARFDYQPRPGFTGMDRFVVRASVGGRDWTIPVAVSVTHLDAASDAPPRPFNFNPRGGGWLYEGGNGGVGLHG